MPERIQRRRVKGWRKPPNTVCVTRPSRWENPFKVLPDLPPGTEIRGGPRSRRYIAVPTPEEAVRRFRDEHMTPERREQAKRELRGFDLACYCERDEPCHADVLLAIANG